MLGALIVRRADPQTMAARWASARYGVYSRGALGNSRSALQAVITTASTSSTSSLPIISRRVLPYG
jgi:hypothetical protein